MRTPEIASIVLAVWLGVVASPRARAAELPRPSTVAQVRALRPEQAFRHPLVRLTATVTYYDAIDRLMFVQDGPDAMFVDTDRDYSFGVGALVEITGRVKSDFTNTVIASSIRKLGVHRLPTPKAANFHEIARGHDDCTYIALTGTIRSVSVFTHVATGGPDEKLMQFTLATAHGEIQVHVLHFDGLPPDRLADATVRLKGVAGAYFTDSLQFNSPLIRVNSVREITVLASASTDAFATPPTRILDVMRYRATSEAGLTMRVAGKVTLYDPGHTLVIQDGNDAILVKSAQVAPLHLGDAVEVVGMAAPGKYRPLLENARFRVVHSGNPVPPVPLDFRVQTLGKFSYRLVSFQARLLGTVEEREQKVLHLSLADQRVVSASYPKRNGDRELPSLEAGSLLRITGICIVEAGGDWRDAQNFNVMIRTPDDIRVLSAPSWWTSTRLIISLLSTAFLLAAISLWVSFLRHRVAIQNDQIQRSRAVREERSVILEMISGFESQDSIVHQIHRMIECQWPGSAASTTIGRTKVQTGDFSQHDGHATVWSKPIHSNGNGPIGEVAILPARRYLKEDPDAFLEVVSNLAALAIMHRELYDRLTHRSEFDSLTCLPNRDKLESALDRALTRARHEGTSVAVAFLDLDSFKLINDQHGHKTGDAYLQHISASLRSALLPDEVVARWGGDEFVVVSSGLPAGSRGKAFAAELGARLIDAVRQPFSLDGSRYVPSASVGIALFPEDDTSAEGLRQKADRAMYAAKACGKDQTKLYNRAECELGESTHFTPTYLRKALDLEFFRVFYQPQFSMDGLLTGFEALVRLQDPEIGLVSPDAFIDSAERSRLIVPLGEWVLRQACAQGRRWSELTGHPLKMAVNVSAVQIAAPEFCDLVSRITAETGFAPELLELELTETAVLKNIESSIERMQKLRAAGVRFAIDDFGMGYSSLSYVQKLPLDTIKIDRVFTQGIHRVPSSLPIVRTILLLASSLGATVIAEGMEDLSDLPVLKELGCAGIQGYAFSRPLPPDDLTPWLAGWLIDSADPTALTPEPIEEPELMPS